MTEHFDMVPALTCPPALPITLTGGSVYQSADVLAHSAIWPLMENFYASSGPDAFVEIPYFATSNVAMAEAYTDCILAYWTTLPSTEHLTIIELAAGSGRLGFLLLTLLKDKLASHPTLSNQAFTLIISDFAESSIEALENHSHFKPFIELGMVDFAVVNPLLDDTIKLRLAQKALPVEPTVIVANYLFDSLPQDAYRVEKGLLHNTQLTLTLKPDATLNNALPDIRQLDFNYTHQPVEQTLTQFNPYTNPLWNKIVRDTAQAYYNASFMLPLGAFRAMDWMQQLTQGQWLLLATDKGSQRKENHLDGDDPDIVLHSGAFSFFVNFDAISQWVSGQKSDNGEQAQTLSQPVQLQQQLCTYVAVNGLPPLPQNNPLSLAVDKHFGQIAPTRLIPAFLPVLGNLSSEQPPQYKQDQMHIDALLQGIRLSMADPYVISRLTRVIYPYLGSFSPDQRQDLLIMLDRASKFYFPFKAEPLFPLSLGIFLVLFRLPDKAVNAIKQALAIEPRNAHSYLWLGKAYDQLNNPRKARDCYHNACVLDNTLEDAKDRLAALNIILNERPCESDWFNS